MKVIFEANQFQLNALFEAIYNAERNLSEKYEIYKKKVENGELKSDKILKVMENNIRDLAEIHSILGNTEMNVIKSMAN